MSREDPWRGAGMEWGDEAERPCRPHDWTTLEVGPDPEKVGHDTLAVCRCCHVRRCDSHAAAGRCTLAVHHPQGTFHRYPDLSSEPVGGRLLDPAKVKHKKKKGQEPPPELV